MNYKRYRMKKYKTVLIVSLFIILAGCSRGIILQKTSIFSKIVDLTLHENLSNELGIYTGQFVSHNGNINIRSTLVNNTPSGRITGWYLDNLSIGSSSRTYGGEYFINDLQLKYNGGNYSVDSSFQENHHNFINDFIENDVIGKEINMKNIQTGEVIFDEKFYVPKNLVLTGNIDNKVEGTIFRKMNKKNFTFGYNYDERNENGILILIRYSGEFYGMSLDDLANANPTNEIKRVVHLKKEVRGEITLPSTLFDGIPTNGIITMYIGRGNGKLLQIDGKEHYIRAFTEQQLRVVIE